MKIIDNIQIDGEQLKYEDGAGVEHTLATKEELITKEQINNVSNYVSENLSSPYDLDGKLLTKLVKLNNARNSYFIITVKPAEDNTNTNSYVKIELVSNSGPHLYEVDIPYCIQMTQIIPLARGQWIYVEPIGGNFNVLHARYIGPKEL